MGNLAQCLLFGVSRFIQDAAVTALNETRSDTKEMMAELARRRDLVMERLAGVSGLRVIPPMGGMFVFIDESATGLSGEEFAQRLLDSFGVLPFPKSRSGIPSRNSSGWALRWIAACLPREQTEYARLRHRSGSRPE